MQFMKTLDVFKLYPLVASMSNQFFLPFKPTEIPSGGCYHARRGVPYQPALAIHSPPFRLSSFTFPFVVRFVTYGRNAD